ncbi:MAG: hypothetical protein Kow00133_12830 [Amphiplicatus sp.]
MNSRRQTLSVFRLAPRRAPGTAAAALLALAACGREPAEAPEAPAPEPVEATEVAAVDEFGPAPAPIAGIAFWSHPGLPFNGLVLAATADGIVAYNIEDGREVAAAGGFSATDLSVAYAGKGPAAQGYAVARVEGGGEDGGPAYRFYAVDNAERTLALQTTLFIGGRGVEGFCIGPTREGGLALHEMRADGWRATALEIRAGAVTATAAQSATHKGGFSRCVVDDIDGAVYAATPGGAIYRLEAGAEPALLARTPVKEPADIGLALNGLVEGGPTEECCGQIALLDGATGEVYLYDREDGALLGAVRLKASFDVDGVGEATAMGLAYGNYGAIYRDGALALATNGERPVLRLAPLNGVMDALGEPLGPTANPRDLAPQEEEEPFVIDIDVVNP